MLAYVILICVQFFQLKPDPPQDQWRSVKMTVHVSSPADLWRVCLKVMLQLARI